MHVAVVGAGISGITCAIALRRAGFSVEVVEQAAEFAEVGAGLSLWPNALAALNELGMEGPVVASGIGLGSADIRTPSGASFRLFARAGTERYLGGVPVVIHRADLQRILLAASAGIPIRFGARCEAVTQDANRATVHLSDRATLEADLIVGADGIHSAVRESVTHAPLRYTGMTSWRAVIPASGLIRESWLALGQGKQFLAAPLAGNRTYIAGLLPMAEGENAALPAMGPTLRHAFTGWHQPIMALIEATPEDKYFRADIYDCPPPSRLSWGRIVLIGDAAHPMTPDLGQGGCLAIEDAIVLARCLAGARGISQGLAMFAVLRVHHVRRVVVESHRIGWVAASASPAVGLARSLLLRSIPASLRLRHLARYASRDAFLREIPGRALSGESRLACQLLALLWPGNCRDERLERQSRSGGAGHKHRREPRAWSPI